MCDPEENFCEGLRAQLERGWDLEVEQEVRMMMTMMMTMMVMMVIVMMAQLDRGWDLEVEEEVRVSEEKIAIKCLVLGTMGLGSRGISQKSFFGGEGAASH